MHRSFNLVIAYAISPTKNWHRKVVFFFFLLSYRYLKHWFWISVFFVVQNYCVDFPCKNGGTCTSGIATFSCQCTSDYIGPTCDTSLTTDHCDPHPCQNGGSCFSFSFGYYCDCPPGFSGDECEIPTPSDHCSSSPCQNGGSCVETPNEQNPYRCDCLQGFPGRNCEGWFTL